ncbi:MAG: hypothetical protein HEQ13_18795 [Dolichospermum sp. DEX189]|nr:hypothetical protein [Dolichospermum sp. DEX189]
MARQKARGKRQEARVKRVWAILHFFTQFGFIVFTYLIHVDLISGLTQNIPQTLISLCSLCSLWFIIP